MRALKYARHTIVKGMTKHTQSYFNKETEFERPISVK